jgi:glutamine amidotransferase
MLTIVGYGLGNIQAFINVYRRLDISIKVAISPSDLADADKLILPGVGAFDWAMSRLLASGMKERLDDLVLNQGCPVLGVCVGMQMMAHRSDEGKMTGLGWIDAEVKRFDDTLLRQRTHLPHMGWNDVTPVESNTLFRGLLTPRFYFLHSYYFSPGSSEQVLATTDYGACFASSVAVNNIYGVQFHPEKSHGWGVQLLKNFAEL